jgi:hypothetical protein
MNISETIAGLGKLRTDAEKLHVALGEHIRRLGAVAHDEGHHELQVPSRGVNAALAG